MKFLFFGAVPVFVTLGCLSTFEAGRFASVGNRTAAYMLLIGGVAFILISVLSAIAGTAVHMIEGCIK